MRNRVIAALSEVVIVVESRHRGGSLITVNEAIERGIPLMTKDLKVMDATAIAFCRDNTIPIVVFDMSSPGRLQAILRGDRVGTIIQG